MPLTGGPRPGTISHPQYQVAIYGSIAVYENLLLRFEERLEALRDGGAAAWDPTFSYVYNHHRVANLQLNAVSIMLQTATQSGPVGRWLKNTWASYEIVISLRVHTAYADSYNAESDNAYLLDHIGNYFDQHRDLGVNYRISLIGEINPAADFPESATRGGEMLLTVQVTVEYEQR